MSNAYLASKCTSPKHEALCRPGRSCFIQNSARLTEKNLTAVFAWGILIKKIVSVFEKVLFFFFFFLIIFMQMQRRHNIANS